MCVSKYLRDACVMLKPLYMKYESAHITSFKPNIPVVYTVLSSLPVVDPVFPLCILSSLPVVDPVFPLCILSSLPVVDPVFPLCILSSLPVVDPVFPLCILSSLPVVDPVFPLCILSSLPVVDPVFPLCILSSMFPLRVLYSAHYLLQILLKLAAFRMRFLVNPWQVSAAWLVLQNQINRLVFCVCGPDSNYHLAI